MSDDNQKQELIDILKHDILSLSDNVNNFYKIMQEHKAQKEILTQQHNDAFNEYEKNKISQELIQCNIQIIKTALALKKNEAEMNQKANILLQIDN